MYKLKIIHASTRPGRKGIAISNWLTERTATHTSFETELLDLGKINLPLLDEPNHPRLRKYQQAHTHQWSAKIEEADALVFVTAEYNYGIPGSLKNALDYLFHEWAYKPAGIVSYGGASGGTRAAQMLKEILTAFKIVPLPEGLILNFFTQFLDDDGNFMPNEVIEKSTTTMLDEMARWTGALEQLRRPDKKK